MKNKAFILALLLAGCVKAPPDVIPEYRKSMNLWIGRPAKELIGTWGIPERQYDIGRKSHMIVYLDQHTIERKGMKPLRLRCEITFTAVKGRITAWEHQGNGCDNAIRVPNLALEQVPDKVEITPAK